MKNIVIQLVIKLWMESNANVLKKNKTIKKNRIIEDFMIVESSENLDCFDLARNVVLFKQKYMELKYHFIMKLKKQ